MHILRTRAQPQVLFAGLTIRENMLFGLPDDSQNGARLNQVTRKRLH